MANNYNYIYKIIMAKRRFRSKKGMKKRMFRKKRMMRKKLKSAYNNDKQMLKIDRYDDFVTYNNGLLITAGF